MKYCRSCRAFIGTEEYVDRPDPEILNAKVQVGNCRRYAPHPVTVAAGAGEQTKKAECFWPTVNSDDGCGEWEPAFE